MNTELAAGILRMMPGLGLVCKCWPPRGREWSFEEMMQGILAPKYSFKLRALFASLLNRYFITEEVH